jgi:hypothetical protein
MERVRVGVGVLVACFFALSFVAHSILGWGAVQGELTEANTPAALVLPIGIAWRLGGAAMLIFGGIVAQAFLARARKEPVSMFAPALVGAGYLAYGAWAWVASGFEPFFLILFVIPGALLALACTR